MSPNIFQRGRGVGGWVVWEAPPPLSGAELLKGALRGGVGADGLYRGLGRVPASPDGSGRVCGCRMGGVWRVVCGPGRGQTLHTTFASPASCFVEGSNLC